MTNQPREKEGAAKEQGLKNCPFCESELHYTRSVNGSQIHLLGCSDCDIHFKAQEIYYPSRTELTRDIVAAWNRRSPQVGEGWQGMEVLRDYEGFNVIVSTIHKEVFCVWLDEYGKVRCSCDIERCDHIKAIRKHLKGDNVPPQEDEG